MNVMERPARRTHRNFPEEEHEAIADGCDGASAVLPG